MAANANYATWNRLATTNAGLSYSGFVLDFGNTRFRGDTGGTSTVSSTSVIKLNDDPPDAAENNKFPLPSVLNTSFSLPSTIGYANPDKYDLPLTLNGPDILV